MRRLIPVALFLVACGEDPVEPQVDDCAIAEVVRGSGCTALGVQQCARGFIADRRGGCEPVLPAEACPSGKLAVPGDTACRDVAPCPDDRFGEAPREPTHRLRR